MFKFLKRLFSGSETRDPDAIREDLWIADFRRKEDRAFPATDEAGYRGEWTARGYELTLLRKDLFAWVEKADCRYADFAMEAEFSFGEGNGHSACGLAFRMADERDFMSALVSKDGYFRVDTVFNGSQRPLIAWTETPRPLGASFRLRVIALAGSFTVMIDDEWAGEVADETFSSGSIAFAAQNYGDRESASFLLGSIFVESRPAEVAAWSTRYGDYVIPSPEARARLAETFLAAGEYLLAAVQIRRVEKHGVLGPRELFLRAEASLRLGLYDEALRAIDECLALDPADERAWLERANLLYLQNRHFELRETLEKAGVGPGSPPTALNLLGHARHNLGDFRGAAEAYLAAADAEPSQPLFRLNAARSLESSGQEERAAEAYLRAARGFFAAEDFADLDLCLSRLSDLGVEGEETDILRAKSLYRDRRLAEAETLLARAVGADTKDAAAWYLLGLIDAAAGRRALATGRFRRAVELDPDEPLYRFRLAEALWLSGEDGPEFERELALALEANPDDGWTLNLAGMAATARWEYDKALAYLEKAVALLPDESAPAINLSELRSRSGDDSGALAALEGHSDAAAANQRGNVLAKRGDTLRAAAEYRAAVAGDEANPDFRCNLVACYLEMEAFSDAEEQLRRVLDSAPIARAYLLAGNLALVFGDFARAETAFRAGLADYPGDADLLAGLARCYLERRDGEKAVAVAKELAAVDPERAETMRTRIRETLMERLSCASCGREWWVPRVIPPQSADSIRAMPPDESPAGACPSCGKVYCIACRKGEISSDSRLTCAECGVPLKLADNRLRYLVRKALSGARDGD